MIWYPGWTLWFRCRYWWGILPRQLSCNSINKGHFTCALASYGSMKLRWISPAWNAYGKHFKWEVNKENAADKWQENIFSFYYSTWGNTANISLLLLQLRCNLWKRWHTIHVKQGRPKSSVTFTPISVLTAFQTIMSSGFLYIPGFFIFYFFAFWFFFFQFSLYLKELNCLWCLKIFSPTPWGWIANYSV